MGSRIHAVVPLVAAGIDQDDTVLLRSPNLDDELLIAHPSNACTCTPGKGVPVGVAPRDDLIRGNTTIGVAINWPATANQTR